MLPIAPQLSRPGREGGNRPSSWPLRIALATFVRLPRSRHTHWEWALNDPLMCDSPTPPLDADGKEPTGFLFKIPSIVVLEHIISEAPI